MGRGSRGRRGILASWGRGLVVGGGGGSVWGRWRILLLGGRLVGRLCSILIAWRFRPRCRDLVGVLCRIQVWLLGCVGDGRGLMWLWSIGGSPAGGFGGGGVGGGPHSFW